MPLTMRGIHMQRRLSCGDSSAGARHVAANARSGTVFGRRSSVTEISPERYPAHRLAPKRTDREARFMPSQ